MGKKSPHPALRATLSLKQDEGNVIRCASERQAELCRSVFPFSPKRGEGGAERRMRGSNDRGQLLPRHDEEGVREIAEPDHPDR